MGALFKVADGACVGAFKEELLSARRWEPASERMALIRVMQFKADLERKTKAGGAEAEIVSLLPNKFQGNNSANDCSQRDQSTSQAKCQDADESPVLSPGLG
jgi:hypothetical protein